VQENEKTKKKSAEKGRGKKEQRGYTCVRFEVLEAICFKLAIFCNIV
jgi:hypothetical protein